ncbi:MAG: hypothetical protein EXR72_15570 [Myxococcales bacterium]|nr:hypothetical protein [Myxococcales bacterium]
MRVSLPIVLLLALPSPACSPPDECEAVSSSLSGNMGHDVIGTWESLATDAPIVYEFDDDGAVHVIEPPSGRGAGSIRSGSFAVADHLLTLRLGGRARTTPIAVTPTRLIGLGPDYRRVTCRGYGF